MNRRELLSRAVALAGGSALLAALPAVEAPPQDWVRAWGEVDARRRCEIFVDGTPEGTLIVEWLRCTWDRGSDWTTGEGSMCVDGQVHEFPLSTGILELLEKGHGGLVIHVDRLEELVARSA